MTANMTWPIKRLGELAEFRNGVNYNKSSFGVGVKVVGVKDFQDYTKPRYGELEQINPNGVVTERNILRDGDIVFVRSNGNRELIGRSLFIETPPEEVTHSAFTIRLRFISREVHPKFYAYLFRTPLIRKGLTAYGGGTNISNLNQDILGDLEIPVPPLPVQRRIADILSAYDDLIENNQRRIKILEEMARLLYREWFVNFRFPGHEKAPLVDSPVGLIPKGWEVKKLGDHLVALETGKRPKGGVSDVVDGVPSIGAENIHGIGQHDYSSEKFVSRQFFSGMRKGVIRDRDVAIYKDGAYIGRSSYFRDGFPHTECCVNEHVFLLRTDGERLTQNAFYLWLQEPDTVHAIRATNANAAQPGINQKGLSGLDIVLPDEKIALSFDRLVEPSLAGIITLAQENKNLRRTRDLLMPRLISGQIDIAPSVTLPTDQYLTCTAGKQGTGLG
jgi:type I restriction enzyme, S subunit